MTKKQLENYITEIRPKADCYDRICQILGIENDILGYIQRLKANPVETLVIPNLGGNKYQILKRLNKEMEFIGDPVYHTDLTECEKHINKMPIEFEVMIYVERA